MEIRIQEISDYLDKFRKILITVIGVVLAMIFIRGCINQIFDYKDDIEYLKKSLVNLYARVENDSNCDNADVEKLIFNTQREIIGIIHEAELRKSEPQQKGVTSVKKERYDFALESIGGRVVSYHSTQLLYNCGTFLILMGRCHKINPPEKAIQRNVAPGEAFCFKGNQGSITIRLSSAIVVDSITIDHVERSVTPKLDFSDAPKTFSITGMNTKHDPNGHEYGNFSFNPTVSTSQVFYLEPSLEKYQYININVTENHGNQNQTCIYRIQVHGYNNE